MLTRFEFESGACFRGNLRDLSPPFEPNELLRIIPTAQCFQDVLSEIVPTNFVSEQIALFFGLSGE